MADIAYLELGTVMLIITILVALLIKAYLTFSFFSKLNIPHTGVIKSMSVMSSCMPLALWEIHKRCGSNKIFGFFLLWSPVILIKDVELIKQVLVRRFTNFYDRGIYVNEEKEPLSGNLFALEGEKRKNLRQKLSPAFTAGRTKGIFPIATKFGDTLVKYIEEHHNEESVECSHLLSKYTLSIISSFAFGVESDIFDNNSQFMKMANKFNQPSYDTLFRTFVLVQLRNVAKLLPFNIIPNDISSFFITFTLDAVKIREKSDIPRDDFLQMLIQLMKKGSLDKAMDDGTLTMNQVAAQTFVFIMGGSETSALILSWALYELALNPDIQRRLQAEIDSVSDWTLENINNLEYLDMVLSEALRMYPSVPFITRHCNTDTVLEGCDFVIKKGMDINISVTGLHRDPDLFPNPDVFDPDRFGPNAKHPIQPYFYLPFGEGP